ncbi:MAG: FAD-binding protein [Gammaproteobacteria bacterium]
MSITSKNKTTLLEFATKHSIRYHIGFKNFTKNVIAPNAIVFAIEHKLDLQNLITLINQFNKVKEPGEQIVLRAAAGGKTTNGAARRYSNSFSMTPCAEGDVIVNLVGDEFQTIEVIDQEKSLVRVGAGVQIGELDRILFEKHKLSLPTSSLIPHVTFVGLSVTGHGTGQDQPAIAGLIRAMTICRPDGKIVRIDNHDPDFEIIRASHLGLFGVVLNVEIECITAKKLQCVTEARSINELIQEIKDGLFFKYPYISIMYIPTYQTDERNQKNVIVLRWEPVSLDVNNTHNSPKLSHFEQELAIRLNNLFNIPGFLTTHSQLIPAYMKHLVSRMEVGLKDNISVGPWHDIAHYQTAFPWNLDDADYLFNTRKKGCDEIVAALEHLSDTLESYAKKQLYPIIDAVYLRFFKGTNGGLSTSFHRPNEHVCGFDIVSSARIPGYAAFKKDLGAFFYNKLAARPHWGKTVPLDINYAAVYGTRFNELIRALSRWYEASGSDFKKSLFLNNFFRQILQVSPTKIFAPVASGGEEKKEEKSIPFAEIKVVITHLLELIDEQHFDTAPIRELKKNLLTIINTPQVVRFHFKTEERRLAFLKSHHEQVKQASEKNQEQKESTAQILYLSP